MERNQPGESHEATARSPLDISFKQCAHNIREVARLLKKTEEAKQLQLIARHVDDTRFRLRIWGSEMSKYFHGVPTFHDICAARGDPVSWSVENILLTFGEKFDLIRQLLDTLKRGT